MFKLIFNANASNIHCIDFAAGVDPDVFLQDSQLYRPDQ